MQTCQVGAHGDTGREPKLGKQHDELNECIQG